MAKTTYLQLDKLGGTESIRNFPTIFNGNMDTLDSVVAGELGEAAAISDANQQTTRLARFNSSTLHTPYKDGLVTSSAGMIIESHPGSSYSAQLSMLDGNSRIFGRSKSNGSWGTWLEYARVADVIKGTHGNLTQVGELACDNSYVYIYNASGTYVGRIAFT